MASSAAGDRSAGPSDATTRSVKALCGLNFLLADVRDGLGPFLGIFLIGKGWGTDTIGYVMTIGGIAGMLATTPLGALADATKAKRMMVAVCAVLVIVASLAILFFPNVPVVAASQIATGIAGAAIGPALAGLTLGLVGQAGLAHQLGRNEAWNHGGNGVAAALSGFFGYQFGLAAVFILMTILAAGSLVALALIRSGEIDHDVARGLERSTSGASDEPSKLRTLLKNRRLLILAATTMLFNFGNGAMLPLLGQRDATAGFFNPAAYTAATVVIAQLTMIPVALISARIAGRRGYYYVLLAALIALPIRGLLAGLWDHPYAVLPVQMLDGVGAGILGFAVPGLVAEIMRGSGRVNVSLGSVMTVQGIGASLSPAIGGFVAARYGFETAFLVLGAFPIPALVLWLAASASFREAGPKRDAGRNRMTTDASTSVPS